jgi:hypothetical protein
MIPEACSCGPETFWTLLHDAAHWQFEIFLVLLVDGVIGAAFVPFVKKRWKKHHQIHHQDCGEPTK